MYKHINTGEALSSNTKHITYIFILYFLSARGHNSKFGDKLYSSQPTEYQDQDPSNGTAVVLF